MFYHESEGDNDDSHKDKSNANNGGECKHPFFPFTFEVIPQHGIQLEGRVLVLWLSERRTLVFKQAVRLKKHDQGTL